MRYIEVPLSVLVCCVCALVFSVGGHTLGWLVLIPDLQVSNFPLPIRPAALEITKTARLGFFANDTDWDSMFPEGDGYLYLPQPDEYYFVAHYHQLDCLRNIRNVLKRENVPSRAHIDFCYSYLLQTLLCNLDLTLESASHKQVGLGGHIVKAVTGFGVTHQCQDWSQLGQYLTEKYDTWPRQQ